MKNRPLLKDVLGTQMLYLDGGTGSVLQSWGLKPGELPERWNITHPDKITELGYLYYRAGSNIICTNTFGAFCSKFSLNTKNSPASNVASSVIHAQDNLESIIKAAVANAKKARDRIENEPIPEDELKSLREAHLAPEGLPPSERLHYIAFDIGPCGKLLKPMGDLDFEDSVTLFKQSFRIGIAAGVDAVYIETMNDSYEVKSAVVAAKEVMEELNVDLPILASTVYDETGRLLTGADPETMTAILEGLGVSAFGMNCSLGPKQMAPIVPRLTAGASLNILVKPNAGLPRTENGKTVYDVLPEEFASIMKGIAEDGANILGGCCGTTPEYICSTVNATQDKKPAVVTQKQESVISSYTHIVKLGGNNPPVLIGERINPTGKKKFKEALRNKDLAYIVSQGLEQEQKGVHVLDVNVGLPEIDEKQMMLDVEYELQSVTALPLQLDTSSPEVMEAALRRYNGKALVNSVNGKQEVMKAVFPLVKKYGGVVVALTIDEDGIPETMEGRMKIVKKLYDTAASYGIAKKDIIIDPLAMAVSSDDKAPIATLETVRAVYEMGGNTLLGISNISFGLPEREIVTAAFFTMALQNGLSAAIMNPNSLEMMKAYTCFCLLSMHDPQCLSYLSFAQKYAEKKEEAAKAASSVQNEQALQQIASIAAAALGGNPIPQIAGGSAADSAEKKKPEQNNSGEQPLTKAIIKGLKTESANITAELVKTTEPLAIINDFLIPALDIVGKGFEAKKVYLPQLLMSAEAAGSAFAVIKEYLAQTGKTGKSRGTIILAT
nr:homocysteine S-methyltransferase family protein [Treponema sp.]